jgi:hypothetical protein
LIHEKVRVPIPTTLQVATVRHKASVPVNSQIARIDAATAMKRQVVVIQNVSDVTRRGLRNPRVFRSLCSVTSMDRGAVEDSVDCAAEASTINDASPAPRQGGDVHPIQRCFPLLRALN